MEINKNFCVLCSWQIGSTKLWSLITLLLLILLSSLLLLLFFKLSLLSSLLLSLLLLLLFYYYYYYYYWVIEYLHPLDDKRSIQQFLYHQLNTIIE